MSAMKSILPFLSIALLFASCTTAYKSGQTPDDVYYSPARPQDEYVRKDREDRRERETYYDDVTMRDDRYLRMKIRDRRYASLYEDDYYSYNPYNYHYVNGSLFYNSPFSSYSYWNYFYNPSCVHSYVGNIKTPIYTRPRTFDLRVFDPNTPATGSFSKGTRSYGTTTIPRNYGSSSRDNSNYRNTGRNAGEFLRDAFGGSNSSSSSKSSPNPSSSSGSSSSGSRSSSNAPARKF
jgi:hypothetical protein